MDLGGGSWGIINILAPLLILAAIAWAMLRNRKSSRASEEETERATRELYREENRAHRHEDDDVP